jgi:alkaline phosphatase D
MKRMAFSGLMVGGMAVFFSVSYGLKAEDHGGRGAGAGSAGQEITRIAFGSCCHQGKEQPVWEAILRREPDLFIFLGDNIYADTADMEVMRSKYRQLGAKPGYQKIKAQCPILATWDDHDYGFNDVGREYPMREESEQAFLDFFEVEADSPRRSRPGIYGALMFGPEGKRVQVILLDTRYFRSELPRNTKKDWPVKGRYSPVDDADATILGEAQWRWLEEVLREPAALRILASSIQVIPDEHGWEKWANFPAERERLFDLLERTGAKRTVIISGDRHIGEMSRLPADARGDRGYAVTEVTSSGLTEAWHDGGMGEANRFRIGEDNYREPNFGFLTISWGDGGEVSVRAEIGAVDGEIVAGETLIFE